MEIILNLTQHKSTQNQNCIDLVGPDLELLKALLAFNEMPSRAEINQRAAKIAALCLEVAQEAFRQMHDMDIETVDCNYCEFAAMIGGAPFLMSALESALLKAGIKPCYAFSRRESVEKEVDGKVIKTAVFNHVGFVDA